LWLSQQLEPLVELARIVPRLSSPALCPSRRKAIYSRILAPVHPDYPATSTEGFSLRRLKTTTIVECPGNVSRPANSIESTKLEKLQVNLHE
jgi:hypothetical protein